MKLVRQGRERVCGQASVAMLAGLTLDEACAMVGHRHCTRTRELVAVLHKLGFSTSHPFRCHVYRRGTQLPGLALVQARNSTKTGWHWMVHCEGMLYDPAGGVYPVENCGGRLRAYLSLRVPQRPSCPTCDAPAPNLQRQGETKNWILCRDEYHGELPPFWRCLMACDILRGALRYLSFSWGVDTPRDYMQANLDARALLIHRQNAILNEAEALIPEGRL